MIYSRTRTRGPTYSGAGWTDVNGAYASCAQKISYQARCDDVVGNLNGDNPLDLEEIETKGVFTGDNLVTGIGRRACSNYPSGRRTASHYAFAARDVVADATHAAAKSNPSRAHISIPNFVYELKDMPDLIRTEGSNALRVAAHSNLNYWFAIKPFISDLVNMVNFSHAAEKRMKEIEDLEDKGGLKRRVSLGTETHVSEETYVFESLLFYSSATGHSTSTQKSWATVRWKPSPTWPRRDRIGYARQRELIGSMMLGFGPQQVPINLWNALPWSWLVDWFTDFGDLLTASNNSVAYVAGPVNVMTNTVTTRVDTVASIPSWCGIGDGGAFVSRKENKLRLLHSPGLTASVPLLSTRQLGLLGSIKVLKRVPRS